MLKARISLTKDLSRNNAMHKKSYKWRRDNLFLRFQNINPPIKNKVGDVYNTLHPLTFHPHLAWTKLIYAPLLIITGPSPSYPKTIVCIRHPAYC